MIAIMSERFFQYFADLPQRRIDLPAGGLLFQLGDKVQYIYRVITGEVQLLRHQPDGSAYILQRALPGELLAEASLMSETYHCAAEAATASSLSVWPRHLVRKMIRQNPAASEAYAMHLAREVREARLRAEIVSLRCLSDRLDAWLIWNNEALPEKGHWQRLAQEINVSPAALYRELAKRRKSA